MACRACGAEKNRRQALVCYQCKEFYHATCINISRTEFRNLFDTEWHCGRCDAERTQEHNINRQAAPSQHTTSDNDNDPDFLPFANVSIDLGNDSSSQNNITQTDDNKSDELRRNSYRLFGKGCTFCHLNINGLRGKFDEVQDFLSNHRVAVLVLSETNLNEHVNSNLFIINNYNIIRQDREKTKHGGGMVAYIHHSIKYEILQIPIGTPGNMERLSIRIKIGTGVQPIIITTVYSPPKDSKPKFIDALRSTTAFLQQYKTELLFFGDYNIDLMSRDANTYRLYQLRREFHMSQLITEPTRVTDKTRTLIDHLYVNTPKNYPYHGNVHITSSDHDLIFTTRKVHKFKPAPKILTFRDYKKTNWDTLAAEISQLDTEYLIKESPDTSVHKYNLQIMEIVDKHAPLSKRTVNGKRSPWFTPSILALISERNKQRSLFFRTRDRNDWLKYKKLRNSINIAVRIAKKLYYKTEFKKKCFDKTTNLWRTMNHLTNYRKKVMHPITRLVNPMCKTETNDTQSMAEALAAEFIVDNSAQLSKSRNRRNKHEIYKICSKARYQSENTFAIVSEEDVQRAISSTKDSDSFFELNIPIKCLKNAKSVFSSQLAKLFSQILEKHTVPVCMKAATVTPLYKGKGPHTDANNYRPIAGLTPLTKVFEKVVFYKLTPIIEELINDQQHGFRHNRSCFTALSKLTQQIYQDIDGRNMRAGALFIDLRKAFNSVSHDLLIMKLIKYKVDPHIISFIKNYLDGRVFKIKINNEFSSYFDDPAGVPQGSCLASLLFSVYINDIGDSIICLYILYADDLAVYTSHEDLI